MNELLVTHRLPAAPDLDLPELWLDLEERLKRRFNTTARLGEADVSVRVRLERVETPMLDGELLGDGEGRPAVRVRARPEPLLRCQGDALALVRAAYHLGNRHARVEVGPDHVSTPNDPVMRQMLAQLGLEVVEVLAPFSPEVGAYHHHGHGHGHDEHQHHGHGQPKIHRFVLRP